MYELVKDIFLPLKGRKLRKGDVISEAAYEALGDDAKQLFKLKNEKSGKSRTKKDSN